ncbi:MAG: DUF134 domain-containing protein [Smithellaceae bacterium]|nr:DUF134 domain-containing protein [Smithellaceae bacterium]
MTRPKYCRHIAGVPDKNYFKPKGIPSSLLEEVTLTLDEYEAIRLADLEGQYQEQAAQRMGISRQTFGRIIDSAHRKIADVLIHGKALRIEGGEVAIADKQQYTCHACRKVFNVPAGSGKQSTCPHCQKKA